MFDAFFLGGMLNFAYKGDADGVFFVHDQYCSFEVLYALQCMCPNASDIMFGTPNMFKCIHGKHILDLPLFPGDEGEEDYNWRYLTGIIDANSTFDIKDGKIALTVHLNDSELVRQTYEFAGVPGLFDERTIVYTSTNVLDLFGKLIDSFKRKALNRYLEGQSVLDVCKVIRKDPEAIIPTKARLSDVGYDLSIIRKYKDLTSNTALYDTGFALDLPSKYYVEVFPRSSLSKSGYALANSVGIIDPGYRGNIYIALTKVDPHTKPIEFPFRCCQLVFKKQSFVDVRETQSFTEDEENSTRGNGGFGSTG